MTEVRPRDKSASTTKPRAARADGVLPLQFVGSMHTTKQPLPSGNESLL
jgi:hypothetical protein